ncbi:hypothetical protein E1I69_08780 [Bacillus timonensis]|uniref:Calcineurin-like phosphoesterase domain-containing protein n=1 Tax=Bacillus timonensis TaxID=1033734 RepID=A0A4V3V833_9BACI|nr:metallophosphoesterase [Bacillus timonensis]THE13183.1 hypothetical protein E1I69_08780 [Bacillus timonensis]
MKLKWAHLSDIHYLYNNYETNVMRDQLVQYLSEKKKDIDLLFITGDLAHQGSNYGEEVESFLDSVITAIEISKENLFIIPGNHDIKRSTMNDRLINQILSSSSAKNEVNSLDSDTYQSLLSSQDPFFNFYKKYMGEDYPKDALHFVKKREGFNVVHINTCLIAGTSGVEGKILVGLNKLYEVLKQLPKDDSINIAIGHHTINCIHTDEKGSLLNRFSDSQIDLYLNGHVHKAAYHNENDNYNNTYMFTSGSMFVDGYADPIFLTGIIDTETASGEVIYHRWNKRDEYWHQSNSEGRLVVDGSYKFDIHRLKKKTEITMDDTPLAVDEDEFRMFLIEFHTIINKEADINEELISKDITEKFINMLCSPTLERQFDRCSVYFPIVNKILGTTSFFSFDKRFIIPDVIVSEYLNVLYNFENGDLILHHMINNLFSRYRIQVNYSEERLKSYIRILIFWSINECDIFNEDKRQRTVIK